MSKPFLTPSRRVSLPPVPPTESLAGLIQTLLDEEVHPDGSRRPRSAEQIAAVAGISRKQLDNLLKGRSKSTRRSTFEGLLKAFLGSDASYGVEWRQALAAAWTRGTAERKLSGAQSPKAPESDPPQAQLADALMIGVPHKRLPLHFIGREEDIEAIHSHLSVAPHRLAIYGAHGVGKSMLASAYAKRFSDRYDIIAWIDAETAEGSAKGLLSLKKLTTDATATNETLDPVEQVLIAVERSNRRILLIYDNAVGPAELHPYLPGGGTTHVLITSNSPSWRVEAVPRALNAWPNSVGVQYLKLRLGDMIDDKAAFRLSAMVGGLPIALEIAAAYCEMRCLRVDDYLRAFAVNPAPLLDAHGVSPKTYPHSISRLITVSIEGAVAKNPTSKKILEHLSILAPCEVPLFLLFGVINGRQKPSDPSLLSATTEAIMTLREHSLIAYMPDTTVERYPILGQQEDGEDPYENIDTVSVHRLVSHIARVGISNPFAKESRLVSLLADMFPLHYQSEIDTRRYFLAPHIVFLLFRNGQIRTDLPRNDWLPVIAHSAFALEKAMRLQYEPAYMTLKIAHDLVESLVHPKRERILMYMKHDMSFYSHMAGIDSGLNLGGYPRGPDEDICLDDDMFFLDED